ncbi:MAG TPA: DciA family protein [Alphaproteobacteria bacterium]|nr:DciA family protein [Alphaproteobacteria bacterium]
MSKAKAPQSKAPVFKRKNRALAVAGVIDGLLDGAMAGQAGLLRQLQRRWRTVCPLLGAQSWPTGLNSGGVLKVAVLNSSVAQEMKYQAPTLIAAANLLAGHDVVEKITTVVQTLPAPAEQPAVPPPPAPAAGAIAAAAGLCKGVADNDLRDALSKLGAWVFNAKQK